MYLHHLVILAIGLAAAGAAPAAVDAAVNDKSPMQIDVGNDIARQLQMVEMAIGSERYSELEDQDRIAVRDALGRIRANVGQSHTVDGLAPDIRTAVFNDQEVVNTIMSRAHADSRMVCERVRLTGSNRREQVCMTVAQRRDMRENSVDVLRNWNYWNMEKD
jgi:hypothetical protein